MKTKKLSEREEFAKELLDGLDVVRDNRPAISPFVEIIKEYVRSVRDRKKEK